MRRLTAEEQQEIAAQQRAAHETRRATVPALEAVLYEPLPVLDHGFVRVIDYMGDDAAIVQAARVSYGRGTRKLSEDQGLINYLMRHRHTTPFEMCEIKYHVKLPIFVARQWIRHRTANVNEYSARYSILDKEFYIPAPEHLAVQATTNRQGRGAALKGEAAQRVLDLLRRDAENAYAGYTELLNEDASGSPIDPAQPGLARELARINLSLGFYTQWYWKTDLHNLMHFLSLRADPHAQYEIRAYAEVDAGDARPLGPDGPRRFCRIPDECRNDLGCRSRRRPPDDRRRGSRPGIKRPLGAGMARADGSTGPRLTALNGMRLKALLRHRPPVSGRKDLPGSRKHRLALREVEPTSCCRHPTLTPDLS